MSPDIAQVVFWATGKAFQRIIDEASVSSAHQAVIDHLPPIDGENSRIIVGGEWLHNT